MAPKDIETKIKKEWMTVRWRYIEFERCLHGYRVQWG